MINEALFTFGTLLFSLATILTVVVEITSSHLAANILVYGTFAAITSIVLACIIAAFESE